ncbi:hypothetical protein EJ03DRAFT_324665, partial [Teratosphaeria nubilosa]
MPALPYFARRSASATPATASDMRFLDSRQLRDSASGVAQGMARTASNLLRRIPKNGRLRARQNTVAIPQVYKGLDSGPAPGAVVGIVLGAVVGFLLLIWLLWVLSNGSSFIRTSNVEEEDVYVSRRRSRSPRSRRSSRRTEMTSRSPDRRRERVIRQERIVRDVPPPREPSRMRETVIIDDLPRGPPPPMERRVEGDDIVEVIEEHSSIGTAPPPPRTSRTRRSSGYR